MPLLLLVRHGQASFGGADYDVLSELGHEQARATAEELGRRGVRPTRLVCGALARQRDTAAPIAERFGLAMEIDPRWDEYSSADILSTHSAATAREERPAGSDAPPISSREFQDILEAGLLAWIAAGADGPAAEPYTAFAGRARAALADAAAALGPGEAGVVVTSGGVLAAVAIGLLGVPDEAFAPLNRVTVNAAVTKVAVGRSGATLVSFNEHAHLEGPDGGLVTYR